MQQQETGQGAGAMGSGLKQVAMALGLVFVVTLAVVVGKQMSTEAMAVVVGIVCGVAASIPTSLLLLAVLNRRDRVREEEVQSRAQQASYPPVVVIQGGGGQMLPPGGQAGYWPMPAPGPMMQRQFHVVGGDELLAADQPYWNR